MKCKIFLKNTNYQSSVKKKVVNVKISMSIKDLNLLFKIFTPRQKKIQTQVASLMISMKPSGKKYFQFYRNPSRK